MDDGKINSNGGSDFLGMPQFKAREAVSEALQKKCLPSARECKRAESIMISCDYPSTIEGWNNERVENEMDIIESTVKSLRSLAKERRDTYKPTGFSSLPNTVVTEIINSHQVEIVTLPNLSSLTVITENDAVPLGYAETIVNEKPFCLYGASKN